MQIGAKLAAYKNRLFEMVQFKLDEGKEEKQIMKELKDEFDPTLEVLDEIEQAFFKQANSSDRLVKYDEIMRAVTQAYNDWEISEEDYNKVKAVYDSLDDPAHIASYLEELQKVTTEILNNKTAKIKKLPEEEKWRVYSEAGKNMGTYDTVGEAKDRLRQIEFFKHQSLVDSGPPIPEFTEGGEAALTEEIAIAGEYNIQIPKGLRGHIHKIKDDGFIQAQFDIDDIIINGEEGEAANSPVKKEFEEIYGHYIEVNLVPEVLEPIEDKTLAANE